MTSITTSFESEAAGSVTPADPFYSYAANGTHEVTASRATDGTHSFQTGRAPLGSPSAIGITLDTEAYDSLSFDIFTIRNNPNHGNIKVSLDGAGYGSSKTGVWSINGELNERDFSPYRDEDRWYRGCIADLTEFTGDRELIFWVDGDNRALWDNIQISGDATTATSTTTPTPTKTAPPTPPTETPTRLPDTETPTITQTRTQTQTPTPANTTTAAADALRNATRVATVTIEGRDFFVLNDIPSAPADQYAFTTAEYDLLEPNLATDVAISYEFCDHYPLDSQSRLEYTNNQHEGFGDVETMARAANILASLSGAVAMAAVDPKSVPTSIVNLATNAVDWAARESTNPYYEQFAKIGATTGTITWADTNVPNADTSLLNASREAADVTEHILAAHAVVEAGQDVAQSASRVREVVSRADSIRSNVDPSAIDNADDLRSTGYTLLAGLAVSATVSSVVSVAEAQAKSAAMGKASAGVRRPLLNELLELEDRASNYNLGAAGIIRMQALRQTDYQIEAAAWSGIHEIYRGLSSGLLGGAYDAFLDADGFADTAARNADTWSDLSQLTMVQTGRLMDRGVSQYNNSLNYREFGQQTLIQRQ